MGFQEIKGSFWEVPCMDLGLRVWGVPYNIGSNMGVSQN